MGHLRFYRRVRIFPGVWLNLTKTGISLSFGRRGLTVTVGRNGIRFTAGLPGTGLFYTTRLPRTPADDSSKSRNANTINPETLATLKKELDME